MKTQWKEAEVEKKKYVADEEYVEVGDGDVRIKTQYELRTEV